MSRLLDRLLGRAADTTPQSAIDLRLLSERPKPPRGFADATRRTVAARWRGTGRPDAWRLRAAALIVVGVGLLIAALVVAAS